MTQSGESGNTSGNTKRRMTSDELIKKLAGKAKDGDTFYFFWGDMKIPAFLSESWENGGWGITKFVALEMLVAVMILAIFIPMAAKVRGGQPVKGRLWNLLEVFLVYLRDNVIVAAIGCKKTAAPYVPYLWTLFFFILFCNLVGLIPGLSTPTAAIAITSTLALLTLITVIATGILRHGVIGFWTGMVPHVEGKVGPINLALVMSPVLFVLEIFGFFIKHCTLCIRLMANMFGGGLILGVLVAFIPMVAGLWYVWSPAAAVSAWCGVTFLSVLGLVALTFLKLLVSFLQAYIFTFLTSIYIGMAINQH